MAVEMCCNLELAITSVAEGMYESLNSAITAEQMEQSYRTGATLSQGYTVLERVLVPEGKVYFPIIVINCLSD